MEPNREHGYTLRQDARHRHDDDGRQCVYIFQFAAKYQMYTTEVNIELPTFINDLSLLNGKGAQGKCARKGNHFSTMLC